MSDETMRHARHEVEHLRRTLQSIHEIAKKAEGHTAGAEHTIPGMQHYSEIRELASSALRGSEKKPQSAPEMDQA
jgi:hypothetical protein